MNFPKGGGGGGTIGGCVLLHNTGGVWGASPREFRSSEIDSDAICGQESHFVANQKPGAPKLLQKQMYVHILCTLFTRYTVILFEWPVCPISLPSTYNRECENAKGGMFPGRETAGS